MVELTMSRLIYDMYYAGEITLEQCMRLIDKWNDTKNRARYRQARLRWMVRRDRNCDDCLVPDSCVHCDPDTRVLDATHQGIFPCIHLGNRTVPRVQQTLLAFAILVSCRVLDVRKCNHQENNADPRWSVYCRLTLVVLNRKNEWVLIRFYLPVKKFYPIAFRRICTTKHFWEKSRIIAKYLLYCNMN